MMYGYMGRVYVHTHAHRRQTLPWKWIRWQMVSERELLSRAEFTLSCSSVLREESNKGKPAKKEKYIPQKTTNKIAGTQRLINN